MIPPLRNLLIVLVKIESGKQNPYEYLGIRALLQELDFSHLWEDLRK